MPEKITETKAKANQPQLPPIAPPPSPSPASSSKPPNPKPSPTPAQATLAKTKKKPLNWKIFTIAFGAIFFLATFIFSTVIQHTRTPRPTPGSTLTPTPVPRPSIPEFPITNPSVYADDPQVLQIQSSLETLLQQLDDADLREFDLYPPVLDMEVRFE